MQFFPMPLDFLLPLLVHILAGLATVITGMEEKQERAKQTRAAVKQLARMLVTWRIGCPWCLDFGTHTSIYQGIADEQLRSLPDYERSPLFNAEERAVLRYADAMTRTPVWVSDDIFEARKRALYRPTDLGGNSSHCLGALPRAGESRPRSGSRGCGRANLPGAGEGQLPQTASGDV